MFLLCWITCFILRSVRRQDLAIPDTYCDPTKEGAGYKCPGKMRCAEIDMEPEVMGFNGFDHLRENFFRTNLVIDNMHILKI